MTAERIGQDDREQDEDFLSRTMPLPAIDIAGYEPPVQLDFEQALARRPAPAMARAASGLEGQRPAAGPDGQPSAAERAAPSEGKPGAGLAGVARGGLVNLAGAVISASSSVALTIIVTRNFSKSVVGTFFVAMSLFLIVEAVTNLGAYNGTIYFIARLRALHAERRIPAILRATVIPVVISSVIGAAALIAFVHPVSRLLLAGQVSAPARQSDLETTLRILAVALPFAALADTMLGATRGFHEMEPTVVVDRIGRSTLQLVGVISAAIASSSALLAPLWALPYAPAAIIASLWLRRIMRDQRRAPAVIGRATRTPQARSGARGDATVRPAADGFQADNRHGKPNARGFWRFTAPRSLASVAQIVIQRLDIVLVGVMKGPVDAAIYTAATRFLVAGQLGNAAISMAAQPQLTRLFAIKDRAGANTVYQVTTAWLVLLTWPIYLLAAVFGPSVLAIFGRSYHAGSTVMLILALTMLVATGCGQVDMVLITTGRSTWSLVNGLLAMGVNICVDLILIPRIGITGAAIGWAAAIVVSNLVPLVQVAAAAKVHPFGRGMVAACGLTVLSFAVVPLGLRMVAGPKPGISIAATGLGAAVMMLGLWCLHGTLHLSAMPGLSRLARITRPGKVRS
ncbi:MAG TPA: oligosaccharide flippase family protein [Streptosporangiaceae bacterium]